MYQNPLKKQCSVYIADTDPETVAVAKALFQVEGFETEIFNDGRKLTERFTEQIPAAVCISFSLDGDGLSVLREVKSMDKNVPAYMTDGHSKSYEKVVEAMRAGATDCFIKPLDATVFINAIRGVRNTFKPRYFANKPIADRLTPREKEVMELLADRLTNKELALSLKISNRTAEVHRLRVFEKLQVRNAVQMVRVMFESGK